MKRQKGGSRFSATNELIETGAKSPWEQFTAVMVPRTA